MTGNGEVARIFDDIIVTNGIAFSPDNRTLYHADSLYVRSMALPLLGTGVGRFSPDVCLDTMFQYLARTLLRGLTAMREARIVLFR